MLLRILKLKNEEKNIFYKLNVFDGNEDDGTGDYGENHYRRWGENRKCTNNQYKK